MKLLRDQDFNLENILNSEPNITSYGSEFKPVPELEPLLHLHPRWSEMKKKLLEGATFPVIKLDDETRLQDIEAMKIRGNHKSAQIHEKYLADAFKELGRKESAVICDQLFRRSVVEHPFAYEVFRNLCCRYSFHRHRFSEFSISVRDNQYVLIPT